jgi:hypothetical protein
VIGKVSRSAAADALDILDSDCSPYASCWTDGRSLVAVAVEESRVCPSLVVPMLPKDSVVAVRDMVQVAEEASCRAKNSVEGGEAGVVKTSWDSSADAVKQSEEGGPEYRERGNPSPGPLKRVFGLVGTLFALQDHDHRSGSLLMALRLILPLYSPLASADCRMQCCHC